LRAPPFEAALAAANAWIQAESVKVVNIETVVLPNIHIQGEQGTGDPELFTFAGAAWNQFIRVWLEK
jgi:hypothetical protein